VRVGRTCPEGFLPVFSVRTKAEAEALVILACTRGMDGQLYARELLEEQTLDNLERFSEKLDRAHDFMIKAGTCKCKRG
jgi:hypothetical protein